VRSRYESTAMADRIRTARLHLGLSQAKLAARAGLHRRWVEQIEIGDIANPRVESVAAIAGALGTSIDSLVYGKCACR
jgi:transcriptional regulator with XRE-family HTH domain